MFSSRNPHARLMLFTVTISSTLIPSGARPSKISCVSGKVTPSTSILAVRQIESTSSRFASSTAVRLSVVVSFLTGSIKAPYPLPIILSKWPCRQRTPESGGMELVFVRLDDHTPLIIHSNNLTKGFRDEIRRNR